MVEVNDASGRRPAVPRTGAALAGAALLVEGSDTNDAVGAVCDRFAAARPGIKRLVIEGAGHMAPFTHAARAAATTAAHIGLAGPDPA